MNVENEMLSQRRMTYIGKIENQNDDAYAQSERENIYTFHKRNTHASIYNTRHALLIQEGRKVGTFL